MRDRRNVSERSCKGKIKPEFGGKTISRRDLLKLGAGIAATVSAASTSVSSALADGESRKSAPAAPGRRTANLPRTPNIMVLMTDQERHHMHWPRGWVEKHLPSLARLRRNGLYFNRAYTAASQCSPSRAVMLSGRFAPINRVTRTFLWPGLQHRDRLPSIATLLREKAGYETVWKGKWHLSYAANAAPGNGGEDWSPLDITMMEKNFGWSQWNPPDAGNAILPVETSQFGSFSGVATLGGGNPNNDGRYTMGMDASDPRQTPGVAGGESVVDFLRHRAPKLKKPFCLFVSLVNPHDIGSFPGWWNPAGYDHGTFANMGIDLPPNLEDDLSTKPSVQKAARDTFDKAATLATAEMQKEYVNFYAYLHTVVDKHITTVLDVLEETGLADKTIVLRFADHGEGGLSHGMREKAYSVYEEMIHIPLIVYNRLLFPEPAETDALYDHLDLMPTILDLAGVPNPNAYAIGESIVPVIKDPAGTRKTHALFSFDDLFFLPADIAGGHIRAIREGDWTYAVYFNMARGGPEYELYNLASDPLQMKNLLYGTPGPDLRREWARLHKILTTSFIDAGNLPDSFSWPIEAARA